MTKADTALMFSMLCFIASRVVESAMGAWTLAWMAGGFMVKAILHTTLDKRDDGR